MTSAQSYLICVYAEEVVVFGLFVWNGFKFDGSLHVSTNTKRSVHPLMCRKHPRSFILMFLYFILSQLCIISSISLLYGGFFATIHHIFHQFTLRRFRQSVSSAFICLQSLSWSAYRSISITRLLTMFVCIYLCVGSGWFQTLGTVPNTISTIVPYMLIYVLVWLCVFANVCWIWMVSNPG